MYRGFKLKLRGEKIFNFESFSIGDDLFNNHNIFIKEKLNGFSLNDGKIDGSQLQADWFPQINSHVFISHSHDDRDLAISLAGWIYKNFGLISFIDSCVWGYANDLLEKIDIKHCKIKDSNNYNYNQRNYSTAHVHMMLSTALATMIKKTECLIFLDTPNSITTSEVINKTNSPWIYYEINMTKILHRSTPERIRSEETRYFSNGKFINERLEVEYIAELSHLADINSKDLNAWKNNCTSIKGERTLDVLYNLKQIKNPRIILS